MKIFSRFNKGHGVSQGAQCIAPLQKNNLYRTVVNLRTGLMQSPCGDYWSALFSRPDDMIIDDSISHEFTLHGFITVQQRRQMLKRSVPVDDNPALTGSIGAIERPYLPYRKAHFPDPSVRPWMK
jgi:hypothetical protein